VIAVLGVGGVGGLVAAALDRAGEDVVVVARPPTAEVVARDGIGVRSVRLGEWVARPRAAARLAEVADVLVVAVKATELAPALARVTAAPRLIVPLLNGVDHLDALRERFGTRAVCAGVIRVESDRPSPAVVVQTSPFLRVDLAPAAWPAVRAAAEVLEGAGIPVALSDSEPAVMWGKLVRLNALACATSAHDLPIGAIRDDPELAAELAACVRETAAVAAADGAPIDPDATLAELAGLHPGAGSSMRRDITAGRRPELDAIPGAVVRRAARHGVAVPVVEALAARVAARAGVGDAVIRSWKGREV
jgi:2-dehydropantoate 2-reductase